MWLDCNLGKVSLEKSLEGSWLTPMQAGPCGVAAGFAGGYMCLHILCRSLQIYDLKHLLASAHLAFS